MKHHLVVEKKETGGICKVFNALYRIHILYTSQSTDRIVLDL